VNGGGGERQAIQRDKRAASELNLQQKNVKTNRKLLESKVGKRKKKKEKKRGERQIQGYNEKRKTKNEKQTI